MHKRTLSTPLTTLKTSSYYTAFHDASISSPIASTCKRWPRFIVQRSRRVLGFALLVLSVASVFSISSVTCQGVGPIHVIPRREIGTAAAEHPIYNLMKQGEQRYVWSRWFGNDLPHIADHNSRYVLWPATDGNSFSIARARHSSKPSPSTQRSV